MGRTPKPQALKEMTGMNPAGRDPKNPAEAPVIDAGIPDPPVPMEGRRLAIWRNTCIRIRSMGLLTTVDGRALARLVRLYDEYDNVSADLDERGFRMAKTFQGKKVKNDYKIRPEVAVLERIEDHILKLEAQFGLTPASRTRIDTQVVNTGARGTDDQSKMRYLKVV